MQKIIVIGSPGAGKSVFARRLSEKTGLPLIHLDMIWHRRDRTNISREEFDARLREVCRQERWIIDGNYARTLPARFENADTVIFLDYPVEVCLAGIRQRVGMSRPDMPWVEEQVDEELQQMVESFPREGRETICALIEQYKNSKHILIFKSRGEAEQYIEHLPGR